MTLTATYLSDRSRVKLTVSAAPTGSDHVTLEQSVDGINWSTVRGGTSVALTAGAAALDDYEFDAAVINTYRATYTGTAYTYVGVGTVATANNGPVTPAHPAGLQAGDLKLILATIRNSGTGTVNTPAGWTQLAANGNLALLGRRHVAGDTAPSVTFTGGAAGADCIGQMAAWHNLDINVQPGTLSQLNGSAQNIAYPSVVLAQPGMLLQLFWKQAILTSTTAPAFGTVVADASTAVGTGSSQTWYQYVVTAGTAGVTFPASASSLTVTGGAAAISRATALQLPLAPYLSREQATITPAPIDPVTGLQSYWIKDPYQPGLNTPVVITFVSDIVRPSKSTTQEVFNRTLPIALTDKQGSRRVTIRIKTETLAAYADMDNRLASGHVLFVQAPDGTGEMPTMYAIIDQQQTQSRPARSTHRRYFELPLVECAAPSPAVAGTTITWDQVVSTYATWNDVVAAFATWNDLVASVSTANVIVP